MGLDISPLLCYNGHVVKENKLKKFRLPGFNLNGTSASSIKDEYMTAYKDLKQAQESIVKATCHPRDFQSSPEHWSEAREQRQQILQNIEESMEYLQEWYYHAAHAE